LGQLFSALLFREQFTTVEKAKNHCAANVARIRQSRPDYGLGLQVRVLKTFQFVPASLGSGEWHAPHVTRSLLRPNV